MSQIIDIFLHLDIHLKTMMEQYGAWTNALLFLIIFCETGLVVMPFLPGDSLLFAAGALAAVSSLNPIILIILLCVAAILGDTVNYWLGRRAGPKIFSRESSFFFRKDHLVAAEKFYEAHGKKTIIIARFMPFVRTFAPFVAGIGQMNYGQFFLYNVIGGVLWVTIFVLGGYFFGNIQAVKHNFKLVILGIIALSVAPVVIKIAKAKLASRKKTDL